MSTTFGNGIPSDDMRQALRGLTAERVRGELGRAFLVLRAADTAASSGATFKTVSTVGAQLGGAPPRGDLVFPVVKRSTSLFEFVAVGRNEGNDIHLPHGSISRFHAYFRDTDQGITLVDARSANGTFVDGTKVARRGEGEPALVTSGALVRFGDLAGVLLDAEGLLAALR